MREFEPISFENLTPEERTQAKNKEAAQVTIAKIENAKVLEIAQNALSEGASNTFIAKITSLSEAHIQRLREEIHPMQP